MKYRTKLYLLFLGIIFFTSVLSASLFYLETRNVLISELRSKVLAVASTAAKLVDGDLFEQIGRAEDVDTAAFEAGVKELREVRDANRREDLYVIYIYTIRPAKADPKEIEVVIDASENQSLFASPGSLYPEGVKIGILDHLGEPWSPPHLIHDRWGRFLSGYAPIYNAKGEYVATLGVNLSAHSVFKEMDRLKLIVLSTLSLSLILGFIAAAFLSHIVVRSLEIITEGVHQIGAGDLKTHINLKSHDEFDQLAHEINKMARGLEEKERLKLNFVRYVSKHVMEKILTADVAPSLKGERKRITVLFSDIRDFTKLSEKLNPEEIVSILNEYLDKMLDVIYANNGTLDKFIGDGLMVEFGAPLNDTAQEIHAIETAIGMQKALKELNRKWAAEGKPHLQMGIGVHSGPAVVGNIGSEKRMEYTAIGDTVNVASRLEHATKEVKVPILMSEATAEHLGGKYALKNLGPLALPGRQEPIVVFSLDETP